MLIECMAGVLILLKCQNKIWLGSYIVENVKKGTPKVQLGCYIVQIAKISYCWGLLLFKMLEQGVAAALFY